MVLKALFLNCTLKKSPQTSNTEAFIEQAEKVFKELDVETESTRIVDYDIKFGVTSNEGKGDGWPKILERVKQADILIYATPIWRGDRGSVAKMVAERFDGVMSEDTRKNGQYLTYNKVGGVMVNGNEDGAKKAGASIIYDLSEHGFTVPVNALCYYVGEAGPGPSYIEAGGDKHEYTNNMMLLMIYNMVHLAKLLKANPYATNVKELEKKAKKMSK